MLHPMVPGVLIGSEAPMNTSKESTRRAAKIAATKATPAEIKARRLRWRKHVADTIARTDAAKSAYCVPSAWLEEIECRPMVDVIVDWIAKDRASGIEAMIDADYESAPTRTRNAHEKDISRTAVVFHLTRPNGVDGDDIRRLVREFYRAGDCGLDNAIRRAVSCALGAVTK